MNVTTMRINTQAADDPRRFLDLWHREQTPSDDDDGQRVTIEEVDGPGWWVTIDLRDTSLEGHGVEAQVVDLGHGRWYQFWCDGEYFTAATSFRELTASMSEFRSFAISTDTHPLIEPFAS